VVLYHLSTYVDPAWDCNAVRNTIDLLLVLDRMAEKLVLVSREAGERSDDDLFLQFVAMVQKFRVWASFRMLPERAEEAVGNVGAMNNMDANVMSQMMGQFVDFGNDNSWLEEMFGHF